MSKSQEGMHNNFKWVSILQDNLAEESRSRGHYTFPWAYNALKDERNITHEEIC